MRNRLDIKKRKYRLKRKKPFYKKRWFRLGLLVLILLGETLYLAFFSPVFQIKEIEVRGFSKISSREIQNFVKEEVKWNFLFFSSGSIFLLNSKDIEKVILERFLRVASCNLKRVFPDKLVIYLQERRPVAVLCSNDSENNNKRKRNCYFIDEEGVVFEKSFEEENKYLKIKSTRESPIKLGERIFPREKLEKFLEIQRYLEKNLKISLESISPGNKERLIVKTGKNWEIYFNLKEDLKKQLRNLKLVLEEKILPEKRKDLEYIDLRFGNRVYYKTRH